MKAPKDIEKYANHYSEDKFSAKIRRSARRIGLKAVYYALTLYYALISKDITSRERKIILGALGYLILPVDLIPDFLPALGYTDDLAALTFAVYKVISNITPEVKAKADAKAHSIFGEYNESEVIITNPEPEDQ